MDKECNQSYNTKDLILDYTLIPFDKGMSEEILLKKIEKYTCYFLTRWDIEKDIDFPLPNGVDSSGAFNKLLLNKEFCKNVILKFSHQKILSFQREYLTFDFTKVFVNLAQIQIFVHIVAEIMQGEFAKENITLIPPALPLPDKFQDWNKLFETIDGVQASFLEIKTSTWGNLYYRSPSSKYPYPPAFLYLDNTVLQNVYEALKDQNIEWINSNICPLCNKITAYFSSVNLSISSFYIKMAQYTRTPILTKTCPSFIDFDKNRHINFRLPTLTENDNVDLSKKIFKSLLLEHICCCRYLSFWCGLLNIITCPAISIYTRGRFMFLMEYLLSIKENVYLHHIFVESNPVNQEHPIEERGEAQNTTRLKLYFTFEDGKPWLARFDLPHIGVPYLHINLGDKSGDPKDESLSNPFKVFSAKKLNHIKLGKKDDSEEVLKILEDTFVYTNFSDEGSLLRHSPKDNDCTMLDQVILERAYFIASEKELAYLSLKGKISREDFEKTFSEIISQDVQATVTNAENILKEKIKEHGDEFESLSTNDIYDLLYESVIGVYQNPIKS